MRGQERAGGDPAPGVEARPRGQRQAAARPGLAGGGRQQQGQERQHAQQHVQRHHPPQIVEHERVEGHHDRDVQDRESQQRVAGDAVHGEAVGRQEPPRRRRYREHGDRGGAGGIAEGGRDLPDRLIGHDRRQQQGRAQGGDGGEGPRIVGRRPDRTPGAPDQTRQLRGRRGAGAGG